MDAPAARLGWKARVALFAAALWWGSATAIGFIVVPMLFTHLPTPALAGNMGGKLFSAQTWIVVVCGMLLFLAARADDEDGSSLNWRGGALSLVIMGMLLALLSEFAVAPHILARENLKVWHSVGSGLYFLQWLCAAAVLWKVGTPPRR